MNEKYIRSSRPYFPKEDIDKIVSDIAEVLEEGRLRNGKNLKTFEKMVAEYLDIKHAVAFDSDSSALETALQYFGVKNREVVVCTNSFISIPNSVLYAGGKVVFADIREETLSMDPHSLLQNLSENTCGVIVTHIAGFPNPDLKEIIETCKKHNLFLIEDATHAIGATVDGQKVGTFGDAAIFAFTPTKVLTTGEGGMLVTRNTELSEFARLFSYYGSGTEKTTFVNLGRHMMMPEISAILGIYQLRRLEEFIAKRNQIADMYNETFGKLDGFGIVKCPSGSRCSYYKYPLVLDTEIDKVKFTQKLDKLGIETGNVFYPPSHLQVLYRKRTEYPSKSQNLAVSERVLKQTITLPIHASMTETDASFIVNSLRSMMTDSRLGDAFKT